MSERLEKRWRRLRLTPWRALVALGAMAYLFGAGTVIGGLSLGSGPASANVEYEYSTTFTTTTTTTSTSTTTTTPTITKPGKGCGDKNHLHERRFECKVTISDVSTKEGTAGAATSFVFTVSLSGQALYPVTVDYATGGGSATASSDYVPTSGTLGFTAGVNTRTITVTVIGDGTPEQNESFYVNLSNPSPNAYLGDAQGLGTIGNDD